MRFAEPNLVDPELLDLIDAFGNAVPASSITSENLVEFRAMPKLVRFSESPESRAVKLTERSIKGPAGAPAVPVRIYQPPELSSTTGCILHMHGGGFVVGSAASFEAAHRQLVVELGCVLVSVEYRLAPETPFPGNIEDCYAVLRWLFERSEELRVDPERIGVMGESAGGGLAAALALLARDRGEFSLAFQHLLYPMLDDRTGLPPSPRCMTEELVWTLQSNRFGWAALLGAGLPGSVDVSPYAAPARAISLVGLPPTFIYTAALDFLLQENMAYAHRLACAGVSVEFHVYAGAFHGFDIHSTAAVARRARRDSREALTRFLGGDTKKYLTPSGRG